MPPEAVDNLSTTLHSNRSSSRQVVRGDFGVLGFDPSANAISNLELLLMHDPIVQHAADGHSVGLGTVGVQNDVPVLQMFARKGPPLLLADWAWTRRAHPCLFGVQLC